jgi:hypothetical protein
MASLMDVYGGGDMGVNVNPLSPNNSNPLATKRGGGNMYAQRAEQFAVREMTNTDVPIEEVATDKAINDLAKKLEQKKKVEKIKEAMTNMDDKNKGILDKYTSKSREMAKLATYSIVICLGFLLRDLITTFLDKYILSNDLTNSQENWTRIGVPVAVFLLLWSLKAFGA